MNFKKLLFTSLRYCFYVLGVGFLFQNLISPRIRLPETFSPKNSQLMICLYAPNKHNIFPIGWFYCSDSAGEFILGSSELEKFVSDHKDSFPLAPDAGTDSDE